MNGSIDIREASNADLPVLKHIWQICFGDSEAQTEKFFDYFFGGHSSLLLSCDGRAAGAAHVLFVSELVVSGEATPCPYVYGIGVLPEFRGLGLGAEISRAITEHCLTLGYELCALVPANRGLFDFYREKVGYRDYFSMAEITFSRIPDFQSKLDVLPITAFEFLALRENLLSGISHIRFNHDACQYLNELCLESGGGLFKLEGGKTVAVAAVEVAEGSVTAKELLCSPFDEALCAQSLANYFAKPTSAVRTPGDKMPFGMLSAPLQGQGYFGFAFD